MMIGRRRVIFGVPGAVAAGTVARAGSQVSPAQIAGMSDFVARLEALEADVDAMLLAGALALLRPAYPTWEFTREGGFGSGSGAVSDDVGAIASRAEYGLGKKRGAIKRSAFVSEEYKAQGLEVLEGVRGLVALCYALDTLVEAQDAKAAGAHYKDGIVPAADAVKQKISAVTGEIAQAIKLMAI